MSGGDPNTIRLLLVMLALGLWLRSRPLLFAWCFLLVSLLPVAFIAHYAGFFLYLPMAGWSLYVAVLLVMARRLLVRLLVNLVRASELQAGRLQIASVAALPVLLALFLAPYHRRESVKTPRIFESVQSPSRQLAEELIAVRPSLPNRRARLLRRRRCAALLTVQNAYPIDIWYVRGGTKWVPLKVERKL